MKSNMFKLVSVTPVVLWKEYAPLFNVIANVKYDDDHHLNDEYRMNAHKAFNAIIVKMNNDKANPFVVNKAECVVNTARQSILSNILGVECGKRIATTNMISVSHRLFNTVLANLPWQVADLNQENANRRIELLQKLVMKRLTGAGIDLVDEEGNKTHYAFVVSTPSQQKTGGMYMGKADVMALPVVQAAMNFGYTFAEFNSEVPTNAVEWLKANALSATPADATEYSLRDVIVMPAVKVKQLFENVARVDANGNIAHLDVAELELEKFDGQIITKFNGQARGLAGFKGFGMNLYDMINPDAVVVDIDGKQRRIGDAVAICTDSCWKNKKFFKSYEAYCDEAERLAQYIPNVDKIWIVREAAQLDEDGEEADYGRKLSRQATQQWQNATLAQLTNLTRKTRNDLNKLKTYDGLVRSAAELAKPIAQRSDFAGLVEALPNIVVTDAVQDWAKTRYERKQLNAAANRIHVNGNYPYICMDPIAMIQVLVEGRDPMSEDLGLLKAGEVYNGKYKDGQKLFAVRYPANYQTAVVLKNRIFDVYRNLGDVAVLPYYGDTIIREDGDFDGDEMMFCPDDIVIRLTEQMISTYKPELIDFPHGKKVPLVAWGNRNNRFDQIAEALWRAMRYNQVGVYSNMAVRCMHLGKMNECMLMHVMAILCLDMVKGTEVPQELIAKAENIRSQINSLCKVDGRAAMPWNQIFRDKLKGVSDRKYLDPSNDTVDTISRLVMTTGKYTFDAQGHELMDDWRLMTNGSSFSTRKGVIPEEMAQAFIESYEHFEMNDVHTKVYAKLRNREAIGLTELMHAAALNESVMQFTCAGESIEDKKASYRALVREMAFSLGANSDVSKEEMQNRVVNFAALTAVRESDVRVAMFVLRVFALDFLRNVERNTGVDHFDSFEFRREAAKNTNADESVMDEELNID